MMDEIALVPENSRNVIKHPYNSMSVAEKIQVMELVWESLRQRPDEVPSPEWHQQVLEERPRRLASGEATISSWDEAKKRLNELGS